MTEVPPLPPSEDPFELLGVPRDADARTLRRAYARLIKVYRPDRHPAEFRRIQEAWELLQWHQQMTEAFEAAGDEAVAPDDPGADDALPRDSDVDDPLAALRRLSEEQGPEAALPRLGAGPGDARHLAFEASLRLEIDDVTPEFMDRLAAAVTRDPETFAHLEAESVASMVETVSLHPRITAADLVACTPEWLGAVGLITRCQALLVEGRLETLLEELADARVARAVETGRSLADVALRIACALAWLEPGAGRRLYELAARESVPAPNSPEDRYLERARLEPAWRAWCARHPEQPELIRMMTLEDSVDHGTFMDLARAVGRRLHEDPLAFAAALDDLHLQEDALGVLYLAAVEPRIEPAEPVSSTPDGQRRLLGFLRDVDLALGRDVMGNVVFTFVGVLVMLALGCFLRVGRLGDVAFFAEFGPWIGGALVAAAAWLFFFGLPRLDARLYLRHVRPRALRLALATGLTPEEIVLGMQEHRKTLEDADRFQLETGQDAALHLIARTATLLGPPAPARA